MATTPPTARWADIVEGLVGSTNERGVRVGWRVAQHLEVPPVDLLDRGARVRLDLDAKGFIKSLHILNGAPLSAGSVSNSSTRDRT